MEKKIRHSLSISCNLSNGIHHGNELTDEYAGEVICDNCGVVLEEKTLSYQIHEKEDIIL
ncbi:MAG: hypothetical protein OEY10_01610 [Nitrosopumilus sp.]|nr:hypothetical protein [Nitrosopumilus sp.]